MEFEQSIDHLSVQAVGYTLAFLGGFGVIYSVAQLSAVLYVVVWSFDRWGFYNLGLDDNLIFLEWIRWPIQQLERLVAKKQDDDIFTPKDKAQIYLFTFILFPILYMITSELSIYSLILMPILGFIFILDKGIFLSPEEGEIWGKDMPREGLPAAWSEYYELNALLWFNTSYLFGKSEAGIHIWQFVIIEIFAAFQLSMTALIDPVMIIWSVVSVWSLISIFLYEFFIAGVTVDEIENEEIPEDIVQPVEPVEEETPEI